MEQRVLLRCGAARCASLLLILGTSSTLAQIVQPDLNYSMDALEPYISEETLEYHYGKHHAGYVSNLNAFIEEDESLQGLTLIEIMKSTEGTVFNNAAQVYNHNFYWTSLSPDGGGEPSGDLYDAIIDEYGTYDYFMDNFTSVASGHFGSGWAWLIQTSDGTVEVVDTHDASNPIVEGTGKPLLTCDVWEHAYYIDYRNGRSDYIEAWWSLVNWAFAEDNFCAVWLTTDKDVPVKSNDDSAS